MASPSGRNGLSDFVIKTYQQWQENRRPLQDKWNENDSAFRGSSEQFWDANYKGEGGREYDNVGARRVGRGNWKSGEGKGWRSNTFINITKQKIMSAYSLVIDMQLAGSKIPFMLKPSPWDDVRQSQMQLQDAEQEKKDIEDMRKLIEQQLLDCNANRSLMRNVLCAAKYGETIAKQVVINIERQRWQSSVAVPGAPEQYKTFDPILEQGLQPGWEYVSLWDFFRDLENDDLQASAGCIHRQLVAPFWLRQKKDRPLYLNEKIDNALSLAQRSGTSANQPEQDPLSLPPALRYVKNRQNTLLYLEFWGRVPRETAEAFEEELFKGEDVPAVAYDATNDEGNEVECMVCVAGDEVVRYARTDAKERPFRRGVWEDSLDDLGAIGVADNAANSQFVLNGAVRAFEDNKKLSANVILAVKRRFMEQDFKETKTGMVLEISEDCDDARKAVMPIVIPDVGQSLITLIELMEKYADADTLIPRITQGMDVKEPQMRAYVAAQQVEKAGKYMGSVIRNMDEGLIEPMIEAFYDYNMANPEQQTGKGSYIVKALGFSSFQNRVERIARIQQFLTTIMSSPDLAKEAKLPWFVEELAKALDLDPDQVLKTAAEKQQEAQIAASQPPNPLVEAQTKKLSAEADRAEADAQLKTASIGHKEDQNKLERAKAVHDMETKSAAMQVQPAPVAQQ